MTYISTGEITTLKHELRDDTVEFGAGVTETLLASAQGTEVLSGLWDDVIVEVEIDASGLLCERVQVVSQHGLCA